MDYFTQQFLSAMRRLREELNAIREGVFTLHRDSQEQIATAREAANAQEERSRTPPILRAELLVSKPIDVQTAPKVPKRKALKNVTAVFSILYAIITALIFYESWRSANAAADAANAAQRAANIASDTFKLSKEATEFSMRPYVTLEEVKLDGPVEMNKQLGAVGSLINSGSTPAVDVTCVDCVLYLESNKVISKLAKQTYEPLPVGPRHDRHMPFGTDEFLTMADVTNLLNNRMEIFIKGRLRYRNVYDGKWYDDAPFCYSWIKLSASKDYFGWCGMPKSKRRAKPVNQ